MAKMRIILSYFKIDFRCIVHRDINIDMGKAWFDINRLTIMSNLISDKIKCVWFRGVGVSLLLYGGTTNETSEEKQTTQKEPIQGCCVQF